MTSQSEDPPASGAAAPSPKTPHPIYNWMSVIGSAIAAAALTTTIFLVALGMLSGDGGGYGGLLLIFPVAFTGLSLVLVLAGYLRERRRQKRGVHSSFFERTVVDPFHIVTQTGLIIILASLAVGTFLLLGAGAGGMAVIEYSESNEFCGQMCHQVMGPEDTAYHGSPHAQIDCVECHVGSGGDSYLRAKIGGLRQLYALATDHVTRPIPTPIHPRRSSDEMCGSCHNRDRFIGYKAVNRIYFLNGDDLPPVHVGMLMKVGGGKGGLMPGGGIHYHMLIAKKVEYIARDEQRQEIAWVGVEREDGKLKEYSNDDAPLTDEEKASFPVRVMECVDCHSRPAHKFQSPSDSVNQAMALGAISHEIPNIKEAAVRALDGHYDTTPEAIAGIDENLRAYYEEQDEDVLKSHAAEIDETVAALRVIYQSTIFPEMKADWRAHPDNLGHRDFPGCFRCHNDTMLDEDGEALFSDCISCHAVLAQDNTVIRTIADLDTGRDFKHPEDGESFEEFTLCSECHTGGSELYD